jgi:glycosyltransferase involved in cell wall biosynthesis
MGHGIVYILPARNEAERVGRVLEGIRHAGPPGPVVVVDDASEDATARVARQAGAVVLRHPVHLGYGAALQTGYRWASRRGVDRLVQMDADGQHDPRSIPVLLETMERTGADLVIGSRFREGEATYRVPRLHRWGLAILRRLTALALRAAVTDPTSGFQALSGRLVTFYAGWEGFPADFPDADVLVYVARCGFRIAEAPVLMHPRPGGRSMHAGWRPLAYGLRMALALGLSVSRPVSGIRSRLEGER